MEVLQIFGNFFVIFLCVFDNQEEGRAIMLFE